MNNPPKPPKKRVSEVVDLETKRRYKKTKEEWYDIAAVWISGVYLFAALGFYAWQLFDIWVGHYSLFLRYGELGSLDSPVFRLVAYSAIGGGLGGTVNGLRSLIHWHAEEKSFGWRFLWKYVALPPLGSTLAVIVYALVQGGISIYSGGITVSDGDAVSSLAALATGALAGYGSHKVFIWLDVQVEKLFGVQGGEEVSGAPSLEGMTLEEATKAVEAAGLKLGKVEYRPEADPARAGKVVEQSPEAGSDIPENKEIGVVIGGEAPAAAPAPVEVVP